MDGSLYSRRLQEPEDQDYIEELVHKSALSPAALCDSQHIRTSLTTDRDRVMTTSAWSSNIQQSQQDHDHGNHPKSRNRTASVDGGQESGIGSDSDSAIETTLTGTPLTTSSPDTELAILMSDVNLLNSYPAQHPVMVYAETTRVSNGVLLSMQTSNGSHCSHGNQPVSSPHPTAAECSSTKISKANSTLRARSRQLPAVPVNSDRHQNNDAPEDVRSSWQLAKQSNGLATSEPYRRVAPRASNGLNETSPVYKNVTDSAFERDNSASDLLATSRQIQTYYNDIERGGYLAETSSPDTGMKSRRHNRQLQDHANHGTSANTKHVEMLITASDGANVELSTLPADNTRNYRCPNSAVSSTEGCRPEYIVDGSTERVAEDIDANHYYSMLVDRRVMPSRSVSVDAENTAYCQHPLQHLGLRNCQSSLDSNSESHRTSVTHPTSNFMNQSIVTRNTGSDVTTSLIENGVGRGQCSSSVGRMSSSNTEIAPIQLGGVQTVADKSRKGKFETFLGDSSSISRVEQQRVVASPQNIAESINGASNQPSRRRSEVVSDEMFLHLQHQLAEEERKQRQYQRQRSENNQPHYSSRTQGNSDHTREWTRQTSADHYRDVEQEWRNLQIPDDTMSEDEDQTDELWKKHLRQCQAAVLSNQRHQLENKATRSRPKELHNVSSQDEMSLSWKSSASQTAKIKRPSSVPLSDYHSTQKLNSNVDIMSFITQAPTTPGIQRPTAQRQASGQVHVQSHCSDFTSVPGGDEETTSLERPKSRGKISVIRRFFSSKSSKKNDKMAAVGHQRSLPATPPSCNQQDAIVKHFIRNAHPHQVRRTRSSSVNEDVFNSARIPSNVNETISSTAGSMTYSQHSLSRQHGAVQWLADGLDNTSQPVSRQHPVDLDRAKPDEIDMNRSVNHFALTPLPARVISANSPTKSSRVNKERDNNGPFKTTSFITSLSVDSGTSMACDDEDPAATPSRKSNGDVQHQKQSTSKTPIRKTLAKLLNRHNRPTSLRVKMPHKTQQPEVELQPHTCPVTHEQREHGFELASASSCSSPSTSCHSLHAMRRLHFESSSMDDMLTSASVLSESPQTSDHGRPLYAPAAVDIVRNRRPYLTERSLSGSTWSSGSSQSTPTKLDNVFNYLLNTPLATPTRAAAVPPVFDEVEMVEGHKLLMNDIELAIISKQYSGFTGYQEAIDDVNKLIDNMDETNGSVPAAVSAEQQMKTIGVGYDAVKSKLGTAARNFVIGCRQLVATTMQCSTNSSNPDSFDFSVSQTVCHFIILLARCRHAMSTIAIHQRAPLSDSLYAVATGYFATLSVAVEIMNRQSADKVLVRELKVRTDKLGESLCQLTTNIKLIKREIAFF